MRDYRLESDTFHQCISVSNSTHQRHWSVGFHGQNSFEGSCFRVVTSNVAALNRQEPRTVCAAPPRVWDASVFG